MILSCSFCKRKLIDLSHGLKFVTPAKEGEKKTFIEKTTFLERVRGNSQL